MSSSIIEAKFQLLDRTIKLLNKPTQRAKVASSDQLRELVYNQRLEHLPPSTKKHGAASQAGKRTAKPSTTASFLHNSAQMNQQEDNADRIINRTNSSNRPRTSVASPPTLSVEWTDLKQQRAQQILQDTWTEIEAAINCGVRRHPEPNERTEMFRSRLLTDNAIDNENYERESEQAIIPDGPETSTESTKCLKTNPSKPVFPQDDMISPPVSNVVTSTKLRCRSAGATHTNNGPLKNWFLPSEAKPRRPKSHQAIRKAHANLTQTPPQSTTPASVPSPGNNVQMTSTMSDTRLEDTAHQQQSMQSCNDTIRSKMDDPAFYFLELRLDHPVALTSWLFQATFVDCSVNPTKSVVLDQLKLYDHCINIRVISTSPIARVVINTCVQFTESSEGSTTTQLPQEDFQSSLTSFSNTDNLHHSRSGLSTWRKAASGDQSRPPMKRKPALAQSKQKTHLISMTGARNNNNDTAIDNDELCSPWDHSSSRDTLQHLSKLLQDKIAVAQPLSCSPIPNEVVFSTAEKKKIQLHQMRNNMRYIFCEKPNFSIKANAKGNEPIGKETRAPYPISLLIPIYRLFRSAVEATDKRPITERDNEHMEGQVVELTEAEQAQHQAQMEAQLKAFWAKQLVEMEQLEVGSEQDFKNHNDLPLARIKRIMKSDEDVRMISAEAPVLFAKACEMFILELTLRSWGYSEKNKRRTLQKEDIQTAIRNTDIFDFLVDVIN